MGYNIFLEKNKRKIKYFKLKSTITIGMPVFNDVDFIEASLLSILNQSFENFKLIISDDGSSDGSADICKQYAAKDKRITYIRHPKNLGISKNMEFLLQQADTVYFMWAGDDDLYHKDFVKTHISALATSPKAIVSFNKYELIDDNSLSYEVIDANYSSKSRFIQILKLIYIENDGFGYGVFKTDKIRGAKFPVWWWPNKKTPYNNIFPSLLYYLNRGLYLHQDKLLFAKRVKQGNKINHVIGGQGNGIKELLSYYLRRFYLINFGFIQLLKSNSWYNAFLAYPFLFGKWFVFSSIRMTVNSLSSKFKKE